MTPLSRMTPHDFFETVVMAIVFICIGVALAHLP
jgi:hypothetical protein